MITSAVSNLHMRYDFTLQHTAMKKNRFDNTAVMYIDFYLRMYYMYFIAIQIILPAYLVELIYSKLYQLNLHNQMLSDSYLNFLLSFNMIL